MWDVQYQLDLPVAGARVVYASGILGNAALEGELKIDHSDAKGENVILTYKPDSGMGATVLNKNLIILNVPKDSPVENLKIIYLQPSTVKKTVRRK